MYTRPMDGRISGLCMAHFVLGQKGDWILDCQLVICCDIFFNFNVQQMDAEQ